MIAYASRTGTRRNLAALRASGWRLFVSATGPHRTEGFPYAIDNGAWTAHTRKVAWREDLFLRLLASLGGGADFIVAPDVVMGGVDSLALSLSWLPRLSVFGRRILLPVQDGMTEADIPLVLSDRVGLFVGGGDEFKEHTMARWCAHARKFGAYCHVGRVNSKRRIDLCAKAGADSFDGSSASRFSVNVRPLDNARRQTAWIGQ